MRHGIMIGIFLMTAVLVSACIGPTADTEEIGGPKSEDLETPSLMHEIFQLRTCSTWEIPLIVPQSDLEALVPEALQVKKTWIPRPTVVVMTGHCKGSVGPVGLYGPVSYYLAMVHVEPTTPGWSTPGIPDFFVLDVAMDNSDLSEKFADRYMPIEAASISIRETVPEGPETTLQVTARDWETFVRYSGTSAFPEPAGLPGMETPLGEDVHLWFGQDPLHRWTMGTGVAPGSVAGQMGSAIVVAGAGSSLHEARPYHVSLPDERSPRSTETVVIRYDDVFS